VFCWAKKWGSCPIPRNLRKHGQTISCYTYITVAYHITVVELTTFFETKSSLWKQLDFGKNEFLLQAVSFLFGRCAIPQQGQLTPPPRHLAFRPFFDCGGSAASFMEASLTSRSNHSISLEFMGRKGPVLLTFGG